MAVFGSWVLVLCAVAALACHTECRSAEADSSRPASYDYYDDDPRPTGFTPDDGMQGDANDELQADEDGDESEDDEPILKQTLLSKAVSVTAVEGDTVWLPCQISNSSETSAEVVSWQRDDKTLVTGPSFSLNTIMKTKIIVHSNWSIEIPSVTAQDSATYTCRLLSEGQNVTHTLRVVSGPQQPSIKKLELESPSERPLKEGGRLVIRCEAEGYPKPTLIWSKSVGDSNRRISSEDDVSFEQDSIVIDSLKRHHEGVYVCMADNNVGNPATKSIHVQIVGKPAVRMHKTMVNAALGMTAILGCTVHYEPRSTVTWMKGDQRLVESADVSIEHKNQTSILRIPIVKEKDFGTYTCVAENEYGSHSHSASLVEEPVVEAISVGDDSLSWKIHSHQPLESVVIEYRRTDVDGGEWVRETVKPRTGDERHVHTARFPLSSLPIGGYEARARASNKHGPSQPTKSVFFNGIKDEPNPESIQAAGVGASLGSGATDLKSAAITTLIVCLLTRVL